jgi:hypothetical protein
VNYGVLSIEEAGKLNKKILEAKKNGIKSGTMMSPPPKKKKVKVEQEPGGNADMTMGGPDRVGSKTL